MILFPQSRDAMKLDDFGFLCDLDFSFNYIYILLETYCDKKTKVVPSQKESFPKNCSFLPDAKSQSPPMSVLNSLFPVKTTTVGFTFSFNPLPNSDRSIYKN